MFKALEIKNILLVFNEKIYATKSGGIDFFT